MQKKLKEYWEFGVCGKSRKGRMEQMKGEVISKKL